MGKIVSIFGGAGAVVIGLILLLKWIEVVVIGLKLCIVGVLILGGLMMILFGIIEMRDAIELRKMEKEERENKE